MNTSTKSLILFLSLTFGACSSGNTYYRNCDPLNKNPICANEYGKDDRPSWDPQVAQVRDHDSALEKSEVQPDDFISIKGLASVALLPFGESLLKKDFEQAAKETIDQLFIELGEAGSSRIANQRRLIEAAEELHEVLCHTGGHLGTRAELASMSVSRLRQMLATLQSLRLDVSKALVELGKVEGGPVRDQVRRNTRHSLDLITTMVSDINDIPGV